MKSRIIISETFDPAYNLGLKRLKIYRKTPIAKKFLFIGVFSIFISIGNQLRHFYRQKNVEMII